MNSDHHIAEVERRARRVKLLLMDCDGVLTDGRVKLLDDGDEQKTFHVRDGQGIALWHRAGLRTGIISGRTSSATERRARDLSVTYVRQSAEDKIRALDEILALAKLSRHECAYIGDDLGDIPVMNRVELAIAVGDAAVETRHAAHFVTHHAGGQGAVREVIELILKAQGLWDDLVKKYFSR